MMGCTTVCLITLLMSSMMVAIGKLPHHRTRSATRPDRGSRIDSERRAMHKFHRWRKCGFNPWENSDHFEGDLIIENRSDLIHGLVDPDRRWTGHSIPYAIDDIDFFPDELAELHEAIEEFNGFTCLKLRPVKETDKDYIMITGYVGRGCGANVGRVGGVQELNLEPPACVMKRGTIHHQFMHATGFGHEHNMPFRDKYIYLNMENVAKDKHHFFQKFDEDEILDYGIDYDYDSIMHASKRAYSWNNFSTIEAIDPYALFGVTKVLSQSDILKIEVRYGCRELAPPSVPEDHPGSNFQKQNTVQREKGQIHKS